MRIVLTEREVILGSLDVRVLRRMPPTPEQIGVVRRVLRGVSLIRGAAGSGKTSTALMSLRASTGATINQFRNEGRLPARILVLTYNNSLKGYVSAVAEEELHDYADEALFYVMTFDGWAYNTLGWGGPMNLSLTRFTLRQLASSFPRDIQFTIDEANYVMGRFMPNALEDYTSCARTGRGIAPQMDAAMRRRLLDEVIYPYINWKRSNGEVDFHDLAVSTALAEPDALYDVIVIDEAQDFSANQLRAVLRHASDDAIITIVTDSAQRIYPRGAPWVEAGLSITPAQSFRLTRNYRNTREIARLAACMADGIPMDDDSSVPDPASCTRSGPLPILLKGLFSQQWAFVLARLRNIDLETETVCFLHLKGGGCFDYLRDRLTDAGFEYCELQGAPEWPEDGPNIGLSTFHSAKGLEFDHVFMIGLAQEHASYGNEEGDDRYNNLRRLLAMGIGRARRTVVLGTKPGEALNALDLINDGLVEEIDL